jgi:hypothetical protein
VVHDAVHVDLADVAPCTCVLLARLGRDTGRHVLAYFGEIARFRVPPSVPRRYSERIVRRIVALAFAASALFAVHCESSGTLPRATDAGADASGHDAGTTFCTTTQATFCADFDRGSTPGADFDGIDTAGGGVLELVDATTSSPPKCLRSALPNLVANELHPKAEVQHRIDLTGKKSLTLDLAMRIGGGALAPDELVRYLAVEIDGGSIGLFRSATGWFIGVHRHGIATDDDEEPPIADPLPADTWVRAKLEITFGRAPTLGSIHLSLDGKEVLAKTLATHGDAQPLASGALVLGLARAAGGVSASSIELDDVVLQLQ